MIELGRKEDCCGCTACASVCPIGCIEMREDSEGFKYPKIDKSRCVGCGRCSRVCPVLNRPGNERHPEALLARTKESGILQECTSGGVFTTIAKLVISNGGIAYGAVYDVVFAVRHERLTDIQDVSRLPGSKYVQSDLDQVFAQLRDDLNSGKQVVFCGTPCQTAGLKNYLGKDFENLLLVDLVCHGVPSPKLWRIYIDLLESQNGKITYANFRSKRLGYHVSVMEERFSNGKTQIGSARTNLMSKCFFRNAADRPICYECPFKTISRCSDLTLFDGWHAADHVPGLIDDDQGYTIILVQSDKGKSFLDSINCFELYRINTDKAISLDGKMAVSSIARPPFRDDFYNLLDQNGLEETVKKLFPVTMKDRMIEKSKFILKKAGILQKLKQMKGH